MAGSRKALLLDNIVTAESTEELDLIKVKLEMLQEYDTAREQQ